MSLSLLHALLHVCIILTSTSSHPNRTASLLVTVQSGADSENIASALSTWLSSVASSATVEPLQIVRYGASEANCYHIQLVYIPAPHAEIVLIIIVT